MTKKENNDLPSGDKNVHSYRIEDILSLELLSYPHPIAVSEDGKRLAISVQSHRRRVSHVGKSEKFLPTGFNMDLEGGEIFLVDVKSGDHLNLTPDWGTSYRPSWSPDGSQLAFYSDKNGKAQLWIWEGGDAEPRLAYDVRIRPFLRNDASPQWTPDGAQIVVKLAPETEMTETPASKDFASVKLFSSQSDVKDDPEEVFMPSWADWFRADIGVITIATGEVHRFSQEFHPFGLSVSPAGTMTAVMSFQGFETLKATQGLYELYLLPLDGNPPKLLADRLQFHSGLAFSWSPDGRYIAYATEGSSAKGELFIISTVDGSQSNLTQDTNVKLTNGSQPPLWSSDGQHLFCVAERHLWRISVTEKLVEKLTEEFDRNVVRIVRRSEAHTVWSPDDEQSIYIQTLHPKNKQHGFHRVNLITGQITRLVEENRVYHSGRNLDVAPQTEDIFYIVEDISHPTDVWMADANFQNPRRLTNLNPKIETMTLGTAQLIDWQTPSGKHLQGALLLPANYVEGQRYPLITQIYGGAFLSNRLNNFGTDSLGHMYLLTNHGYVVFLPDTPMETNDPIRELTGSVLSGIDGVIEMGIADANRLG